CCGGGVLDSRAGAADRRRGPRPLLPHGAGGHPALLGRLRADQPRGRSVLHVPRPTDPVLMAIAEPVPALVREAAAERGGAVRRLARNRSVMLGGTIIALIVAVAILAPVLGTTDPARVEPGLRNSRPGAGATLP